MSSVIVAGDTSGSVTLQAPAVAGTTVLTLPTTSGTVQVSGSAGSFTSLTSSALTSGRVTYASTGGLLADSASLTYDGTTLTSTKFAGAFNGSLGATTPSTVVGTSILSTGGSATVQARLNGSDSFAGGPTIGLTNTAANRIWFTQLSASNNYDWWYYNGSAESKLATLNTSGNLGLGVTPSAWRTIQKAIDIGTFGGNISTINAGGGGVFLSSNGYVNSANDWKRTIAAGSALYLADGTGHYWFNGASGAAGGTITFTQAMTLDASGRLGLGISSPTAKLHIKQGADGFGDSIRLERSGAANYWDMVTGGDNSLYVGYNGTGKVTITSAGDVLVGTTNTDPITAQVNGISLGSDYIIRTCVNSNPAAAFSRRGTDGSILVFHKNVNGVGSISVTTSATAYNTSSDYRLKDNIAPMVGALDTVAKLKPVTYNWKADGSDGQGFIAHELAEVVPDCVNGEKDATKEEEYEISPAIPAVLDEEGNEVTPAVEAVMETRTVPVYQGIDT
jgi:hypothetical protein